MDIYLRIADIAGNVEASGYEGCIKIESLDFGVDGGSFADPNERKHVAALSCVTLKKRVDRSSVAIFKSSCSGAELPKATISFVMQGSRDKSEEYMQYLLDDFKFIGYSVSSMTDENDYPLETLKLAFRRITFKYTMFDKQGVKGTFMRSGFDIDKGLPI